MYFSRLVEDEIFDRIECIVIWGKINSYIYIWNVYWQLILLQWSVNQFDDSLVITSMNTSNNYILEITSIIDGMAIFTLFLVNLYYIVDEEWHRSLVYNQRMTMIRIKLKKISVSWLVSQINKMGLKMVIVSLTTEQILLWNLLHSRDNEKLKIE